MSKHSSCFFLFCIFAFRLFIFVKNGIIILIFNPLPLFSRKRGSFMNRTQKLGNVLIISSRKRMLSEFQSYLHSVLGEYLTFNTLLREQATDPSLSSGDTSASFFQPPMHWKPFRLQSTPPFCSSPATVSSTICFWIKSFRFRRMNVSIW